MQIRETYLNRLQVCIYCILGEEYNLEMRSPSRVQATAPQWIQSSQLMNQIVHLTVTGLLHDWLFTSIKR